MMESLLRNSVSKGVTRVLDRVLNAASGGLKSSLTLEEAVTLFDAKGRDVQAVCMAADEIRKQRVGEAVTYVVNRNINFTNVCVKRCGFCAFSRTGSSQEGYFLPVSEIIKRAEQARDFGASEICIQAGLPLPAQMDRGRLYPDIAVAVKGAVPGVHLHAFSPEEVRHGAAAAGVPVREYLKVLQEAGVNSLPGTSAEILDDDIRQRLAHNRLTSAQWEEVITTAHSLGLPTTATIMYGHIEESHHKAKHLIKIREIQDQTGGITEFVPLSFVAAEAPMYKENMLPGCRDGPGGNEVFLMHALSRLTLFGHVDNIQVSWVKEGLRSAQALLSAGVNDLGGTLMNESISTAAGATHGQLAPPRTLRRLAWEAGRVPVERYTNYRTKKTFDPSEDDRVFAGAEERLEGVADANQEFGSFGALIKTRNFRYKDWAKLNARERGVAGGKGQKRAYSCSTGASLRLLRHPCCPHHQQQRQGQHTTTAVRAEETVGMGALGTDNVVTFSSSYTLVPTYECFNVCTYCNFRKQPGKDEWMSLEKADEILKNLKEANSQRGPWAVKEILVMAGEIHPRSPRRPLLMQRVRDICQLALDRGFWPHTNVGPLSEAEMAALKEVNASMGLMLEQLSARLLAPGRGAHRAAPSKRPALRLAQLEQAGRLGVPFTTGLLLGVGEDAAADWPRGLAAVAASHRRWGHVQEVILQPYSPGSTQRERGASELGRLARAPGGGPGRPFDARRDLPRAVALARRLLPAEVAVQVPPNLAAAGGSGPALLRACLAAGARDLGGLSPRDEVNPDYPFPAAQALAAGLAREGYRLRPRLPVAGRHLAAFLARGGGGEGGGRFRHLAEDASRMAAAATTGDA